MKKIYVIAIIKVILITSIAEAQQLPRNNQFYINPYAISPAYGGLGGQLESFISYRKDWSGLQGAPETKMFSINTPIIGEKIGIGGYVYQDKTGIFSNTYANISYSYHLKLTDEHNLSFGVWTGIHEKSVNVSEAYYIDIDDPIVSGAQTIKGTAFNAGTGVLYRFNDIDFGITIPSLFESKIGYETDNNVSILKLARQIQIHGAYKYALNENISLEPYFITRMVQNSPLGYDFTVMANVKKAIWAGAGYRSGSVIAICVGGVLKDVISLNYSYELSGKGMYAHSGGSHEVTLGFNFGGKNKSTEPSPELLNFSDNVDSLHQYMAKLKQDLNQLTDSMSNLKTTNKEIVNKMQSLVLEIGDVGNDIETKLEEIDNVETSTGEEKKKSNNTQNDKESSYSGSNEETKDAINDEINEESDSYRQKVYYVVISSSETEKEALRDKKIFEEKGYITEILHNPQKKRYYVYTDKFSTLDDALNKMEEVRKQNLRSWVHIYN